MEPSVLAPRKPKPPKWWVAVTLAAGVVGSFAAIAIAGKGSYEVPPFTMDLSARPAPAGKTEFEFKPSATGLSPGFAEAGTHAAPLAFRVTVTGANALDSDIARTATPGGFQDFMTENGKDAVRSFAIKVGLASLVGSLLAGAAISMGRWQRVVGSLIAGVLTIATLGGITAATYDGDEFKKTNFRPTTGAPVDLPTDGIIPTG
jgi:hypothetical protein